MIPYSPHATSCCFHEANRDMALAVQDLSVSYGPSLAVNGVSFSIPLGARLAFTGHNGSGKSTVLKAIAGVIPHQRGHILIFGHHSGNCRNRLAYLAQQSEIDWDFPVTVQELLLQGRYIHLGFFSRPGKADRQRMEVLAERFGLAALLKRPIKALSGGQKQRLLICRALIQEADLLLLDEPFNGLDPESRADLARLFGSLSAEGRTVIVATHDLEDLETSFDYQAFMRGGQLQQLRRLNAEPAAP